MLLLSLRLALHLGELVVAGATELAVAFPDRYGAGFGCKFAEDPVDWRKVFQAYHGWATRRAYPYVFERVISLAEHFDADDRSPESDPCYLWVYVTRLVAIEMEDLKKHRFLYSTNDWTLVAGFQFLKSFRWADMARSPYGRTLFATLASYSRRARELCPELQEPPNTSIGSPPGHVECIYEGKVSLAKLVGPLTGEDGWCTVMETWGLSTVVHQLWAASWQFLRGSVTSSRLREVLHSYLSQRSACGEADIVASLAGALIGYIKRADALAYAQNVMVAQNFQHAIFTRWPVWELWVRLSRPMPAAAELTPTTCLHFAVCERTTAFYRGLRGDAYSECGAPALGVNSSYVDGTLTITSGLNKSFMVEIIDFSSAKQRIMVHELDALQDWRGSHLTRIYMSSKESPSKLAIEALQVKSQFHERYEMHVEPQRLERATGRSMHLRIVPNKGRRPPSIYMVVLDSASRPAFEGLCPRSAAFLRSQLAADTWRMFDFPMFHAMVGGTAPNMLPALSGFHFDVHRDNDRRKSWSCEPVRDGVPDDRLLWNLLKKSGYVTMFGSTGCNGIVGTRYCLHWLDQFDHVAPALDVEPNCPSQHEWRPFQGCKGSRRPHQHLMGYTERLFQIYQDTPLFAYLHVEAAHETITNLQHIDVALEAHLRSLAALSDEARPIVLLAGDHGPPNHCDAMTPLNSLMVPRPLVAGDDWTRWARHLERNRFSIVSWFDVYATIRHIASGGPPSEKGLWTWPRWDVSGHRPRSLLAPFPQNRTCTQAGIPEWQCACSLAWQSWCPITTRVLSIVSQKALAAANEQSSKFLGPEESHLCPTLNFRRVIACEGQADALFQLSERLRPKGGRGEAVLRIRMDTHEGMVYQFYASMLFISHAGENKDIFAEQKEIFNMVPISRYAKHEKCTPLGADPAFCPCAKDAL